MLDDFFTALAVAEFIILTTSAVIMHSSLAKLSEGDVKKVLRWALFFVILFTITTGMGAIESIQGTTLPLAVLLRRHAIAVLITVCAVNLASEYSKFVKTYAFPKSSVQKRLEEWIKDY
jgi:hypothetical protein